MRVKVCGWQGDPIGGFVCPGTKRPFSGSIEFCGGTHIANSAEAERFVIMEESGIAKGVRRIVAVTRSKAREAIANAAALREKVKAVAALPDAELDAAVKVFQKELLATPVGVVDKGALGKEVETLIKRVKKYQKQLEKEKEAEVCADVVAPETGANRPAHTLRTRARARTRHQGCP